MAGLGLILALVGLDPGTAEPRWTFGNDYLTDGLEVVPVLLGLFAVAEAIQLMVSGRRPIAGRCARSSARRQHPRGLPGGRCAIRGCCCAAR